MEKIEKDWIKNGKGISKVFYFEKWDDITEFLLLLTKTIKDLDHHPDIVFSTSSKSVMVILTTHSAGELSEKDITFAKILDEFYDKLNI